jgi:CRP-like cAMP-binding protein
MSDLFNGSTTKRVPKGTILLRKGEMSDASYKVLSGCLRSYVIDKSGKEHIFQFAPEDWIIGDMNSMVNNQPASVYIDALEDSEVAIISGERNWELIHPEYDVLLEQRNKLLRNVIATNRRLIGLLSSTAEERYLDFIDTYPALMQRLPLKLIASYLGITPEYLSEVRRKLAGK